jgi:hypothetical protein
MHLSANVPAGEKPPAMQGSAAVRMQNKRHAGSNSVFLTSEHAYLCKANYSLGWL